MVRFFDFLIDPFSFWVGFTTGLIFFVLMVLIRKQLPDWAKALQRNLKTAKESMSASSESRFLSDLLAWAQRQHLSSPLFPLQAVLIQPRLMAPPLPIDTSSDFLEEEVTTITIPYMPDWPEAAAAFKAPTISLDEALQGGANLLLYGQPGTGKTVALADLASRMARKLVQGKPLANRLPILLHAADILAKQNDKEPLLAISGAISDSYASTIVTTRLPAMMKSIFSSGRALVLIDGLDELQPELASQLKVFLKTIIQTYPGNQFVVTVPLDNFGGLNQLGFAPVAMASWSDKDRRGFISQWVDQWNAISNKVAPTDTSTVDATLIKNWLFTTDLSATPFELTLRTWSAMVGDIPSPDFPRLIENYILRLMNQAPNSELVAANLAMTMVLNRKSLVTIREAENYLSKATRAIGSQTDKDNIGEEIKEKAGGMRLLSAAPDLENLINSGLLLTHSGSQVRFSHALIAGYLAGYALSTAQETDTLLKQPSWIGKNLSISFLGSTCDITSYVSNLIQNSLKVPTQPEYFQAARWLRLSQKNQNWRGSIMRNLANLVVKEYQTPELSIRAVTALAVSGDQSVLGLFRQFVKNDSAEIRKLAILGIGIFGDVKSVNELANFTQDFSVDVSRAACLSLARIGGKSAIDAISEVLLNGSEELRRAAAEVLATNTDEGLQILKDALEIGDLRVRRAVIFGLMLLDNTEVDSILQKTAVSDAEWLVRNIASQALEQKKISHIYALKPLPPINDLPWLLEYASKSGIGISNEKQAMDLVVKALTRGEVEEKLRALEVLAQIGDSSFVHYIYETYYGSKEELREAAFNAIWWICASGAEMPSPVQFGYS